MDNEFYTDMMTGILDNFHNSLLQEYRRAVYERLRKDHSSGPLELLTVYKVMVQVMNEFIAKRREK